MEKHIETLKEILNHAEQQREWAKEEEKTDLEYAKELYALAHKQKPFFEAVETIEEFDSIFLIVNDKYIYEVVTYEYATSYVFYKEK